MPTEDQASHLRELMRAARGTRTVAVTSGKGGVGKSNIALNLAILLSASGHRVALVDADLGLANLDVLADVPVRANLSHVVAGTHRLEDVVLDLPSGVQLVPGASGLAGLADLSDFQRARLLRELTALEADNDVIVVDCSAGIGPDVMSFACGADHVMVVTSPEPTAVTDAYAVIKATVKRRYDGHISLLVNLVTGRHEARQTYQRISGVARQFLAARVLDAGYVLFDPKVRDAVRKRQPFVLAYPRCPASRCVAALATKLRTGQGLRDSKEGFFRRVASWLA
ncbi:MAG: MinD/ParA family protein [Planctomycetes bacterium]|nr:MinD/ParA family protein [Planctomycetota bacterium]